MKTTSFLSTSSCTLALLLALAQPAVADGKRDFYFQESMKRYFDQPQNARTFGMAGSSIATSSDSSSVIGNPAGIGLMNNADFALTYSRNNISGKEQPTYADIEDQSDTGSFTAAVPLQPRIDATPELGNLGIAWSGNDGEWDDSFETESDGYSLTLAYAKALNDNWSLGYGLSYINESVESAFYDYSMDDGFRHTLGVQGLLSDSTKFGTHVFVGHGEREMDAFGLGASTRSDLLEIGVNIGVSTQIDATLLAFSMDYQNYDSNGEIESADEALVWGGDEEGHVANFRLGLEQALSENFSARAGYRYAMLQDYDYNRAELNSLNGSAKHNGWSLGATLNLPLEGKYIKAIRLDYGVEYRAVGEDDWQHVVTVSLPTSFCS